MDSSNKVQKRNETLLDRARDSVAGQSWDEAYELLSEADRETPLDPGVLELLGDAAYLSGRPETSLEAWERVHEDRTEAGR